MALTLTGGNLNGGRELGRISGPLLSADLRRNGVNLAVDTDKLYLNVVNKYVGFGTNTPTRTSTNTPTIETWGGVKRDIPTNVIWYNYKNKWPHYGTGKWITF